MASESASILRTVGNRHSNCSNNTIDATCCIVIATARADFKGRNSVVYALNYTSNGLQGDPVRLHDRRGRYLWQNSALRSESIRNGSVLRYSISKKGEFLYQGNTSEVKDEILKDSELAIESCVYQGITEACPDACIRGKGVCWEGTAPPPRRNFLLTMKIGFISDERIIFGTRVKGEYLNLKLNCRDNLDLSISNTRLRKIEPSNDENSCGDALALIHFCDPTEAYDGTTEHWGVCEGLILAYKPRVISIDKEPVKIQDKDGKYIPLPIGTVKFDSGNDAGTLVSNDLVTKLDLAVDGSKKMRFHMAGGTSMQCNKVMTRIKIRGVEFSVEALAGDPAPGCDLLIGMDIIEKFCLDNYSLGK